MAAPLSPSTSVTSGVVPRRLGDEEGARPGARSLAGGIRAGRGGCRQACDRTSRFLGLPGRRKKECSRYGEAAKIKAQCSPGSGS
ncbi:unnamed protein product [Urochloa humidicola]